MGRCKMPLDMYDLKPEGMVAYLRYNGYHFNKKMCEWAVKQMRTIPCYRQGRTFGDATERKGRGDVANERLAA